MSNHLYTPAWSTRLGNLTAKSVLVMLCDEGNDEGFGFPSKDRIVMKTEINRRTVQRLLEVFAAMKLIRMYDTRVEIRGELRAVEAIHVNVKMLGTDLTEAFAAAYAKAQGKVAVPAKGGRMCLRDAEVCVSETREDVSETLKRVSETFPPHPLIGSPLKDPSVTQSAQDGSGTTPEQQEHLDRLAAKCGSGDARKDHYAEQDLTAWRARYAEENRKAAEAEAAAEADAEKDRELQREYPDLETALAKMRKRCGFVWSRGDELGPVLRQVFADQAEMGKPHWRTAAQMVAAWELQRKQGPLLRARYGPMKFYRDGHWLDPAGWHWDTEKLDRQMQAGTGSAR